MLPPGARLRSPAPQSQRRGKTRGAKRRKPRSDVPLPSLGVGVELACLACVGCVQVPAAIFAVAFIRMSGAGRGCSWFALPVNDAVTVAIVAEIVHEGKLKRLVHAVVRVKREVRKNRRHGDTPRCSGRRCVHARSVRRRPLRFHRRAREADQPIGKWFASHAVPRAAWWVA